MRSFASILKTLKGEGQIAILAGLIAVGIALLLAPGTVVSAAAFGVATAVVAGSLDTLYFQLLFALREAPLQSAQARYDRGIEDAKRRLADGSIRLREALIRRFEEDYRRSVATRGHIGSKRQMREARTRLNSRLWVVEHVLPGAQLVAATADARVDADALEKWTDQVDGMVDARMEVQRRENPLEAAANWFRPARLARLTLDEWEGFFRPA